MRTSPWGSISKQGHLKVFMSGRVQNLLLDHISSSTEVPLTNKNFFLLLSIAGSFATLCIP